MKFLVVSQNAQEREEMKTLLRQLDRRAQTSDVRDWLQARRALSHEPRDLLLCDLGSTASQTEALRLIDEHRGTLLLAGTCRDMPQQQILDLMRGGVKAVMLQSMGVRAMLRALELVLLGTHYIPPSAISLQSADVSSQEVAERRLPYRRRGFGDTPLLSPRQQQIMRLVHMGSTNKGIARALGISEGTVKIHLATVFKTLGASNRAAAVAIYNGWLFEQLDGSRNGAATQQNARMIPPGDGTPLHDRVPAPMLRPLLAPPSGSAQGAGHGALPALPHGPASGPDHGSSHRPTRAPTFDPLQGPPHGSPYGFRPGHPPGAPQGPPHPTRSPSPPRPPSPGTQHGAGTHLHSDAPQLPQIEGDTPALPGAHHPPAAPMMPMPMTMPVPIPTTPHPAPVSSPAFKPPAPRPELPAAPWPSTPRAPARDDGRPSCRPDKTATEPPCSPFPPALPDGSGPDSGPTACHRYYRPTW